MSDLVPSDKYIRDIEEGIIYEDKLKIILEEKFDRTVSKSNKNLNKYQGVDLIVEDSFTFIDVKGKKQSLEEEGKVILELIKKKLNGDDAYIGWALLPHVDLCAFYYIKEKLIIVCNKAKIMDLILNKIPKFKPLYDKLKSYSDKKHTKEFVFNFPERASNDLNDSFIKEIVKHFFIQGEYDLVNKQTAVNDKLYSRVHMVELIMYVRIEEIKEIAELIISYDN